MSNSIKLALHTFQNFMNDTCVPCCEMTGLMIGVKLAIAVMVAVAFSPFITAWILADHYLCYDADDGKRKCNNAIVGIILGALAVNFFLIALPFIVRGICRSCKEARDKAASEVADLQVVKVQPVQPVQQ